MAYKPDSYTDLSPYLLVTDAQAVLNFVAQVFDAPPLRVIRDGGRIVHAEARIGDSVLMMGETPGQPPVNLHLYLPDPDAAFARALTAGGETVQEMAEKGDGDRRGGIRAPDGTVWWLSRQVDPAA